jgi:hypothetical protein
MTWLAVQEATALTIRALRATGSTRDMMIRDALQMISKIANT